MIAIVDYQMGNLRSVQKGFEKVGHQATITSDPAVLADADKIVLPGVGAFGDAMADSIGAGSCSRCATNRRRQAASWAFAWACNCCSTSATKAAGSKGWACCGAKSSASICRPNSKCPTWAGTSSRFAARAPLLAGLASGVYCYFVHSYYVVPQDPA